MPAPANPRLPPKAFAVIFGVSLAMAVGNTGMQSVLPAIGRQIGFPDYMVAAIFSLSALLWAFSSPFWAKASDRRGRKPLILVDWPASWFRWSAVAWLSARGCAIWRRRS